MGSTECDDKNLLVELEAARQRIAELEKIEAAQDMIRERLRSTSHRLKERIKELNCLYSISRLREVPDMPLDDLLQGVVDTIPQAWSYPEIASARLTVAGRVWETLEFRRTDWAQARVFQLKGREEEARLEVCYLEERPQMDEGPFLVEEGVLLDAITEIIVEIIMRKHSEDQHRLQQHQLLQLDKLAAMGTLVSGVAHEINNPNNFVMLNTPILGDIFKNALPILDDYFDQNGDFLLGGLHYSELRDKVPALFAGILEGAERIKSIVNSLKDYARIEKPHQKKALAINEVVASALKLIDNLVKKSTNDFGVEYGGQLPLVLGSFQRLEQVVVNLVQNACEALTSREQGIHISTKYFPEKRFVVLSVRDEGAGIAADTLPRIFDPFFTTKRQSGGTGLGLSVSSGIVKDHGGKLSFDSAPGRGTTATLLLPQLDDPVPSR